MRTYIGLPNPDIEPIKFNNYLIQNNEVVADSNYWILIKNSYIDNQLVLFCKQPIKYLTELDWNSFKQLKLFLEKFAKGKEVYINADEKKSVPNRLHLHIKLSQNIN